MSETSDSGGLSGVIVTNDWTAGQLRQLPQRGDRTEDSLSLDCFRAFPSVPWLKNSFPKDMQTAPDAVVFLFLLIAISPGRARRSERGKSMSITCEMTARRGDCELFDAYAPGAPVATPLSWDRLTAKVDPKSLTLHSLPGRLARQLRDPWEGFFAKKQTITKKVLDQRAGLERLHTADTGGSDRPCPVCDCTE